MSQDKVDLRVSKNGFGQLWPAELVYTLQQISCNTTDPQTKNLLDEYVKMILS